MTFSRILPRSLPGQIVLLAAVALFVAQAINLYMLVGERQRVRMGQVAFPTVTRLTEAIDQMNGGAVMDPRIGVRLVPQNPIDPKLPRQHEVEEAIARGMRDANLPGGAVVTGVREIPPDSPWLKQFGPSASARMRRMGAEILIAVDEPGHGWLVLSSPWPRSEQFVVWQLGGQTLVLYIVVLLPLLLAGHRIARPLRTLAQAATRFAPGDGAVPVEERGPSDVRAVIEAYNGLSQRVGAMLEEKDRMLGAIGHDLRTPLAALRVRIESVEDDTDRNKMADTIDEMNRTLEDILSLARLGRSSEPFTDTDLSALVDAVVEDFRDLDYDVAFEETPRLPIRLRAVLMRRAVRNLIENAVKYAGAAEVSVVPGASEIAIEVADRGPGIPESHVEAVFDPFTRVETSRNRETGGSGLGLALARAIVRDAGGDITLANREGGGLLARIVLPR